MGILISASFLAAVLREFLIFNIFIRSTSNIHQEMCKRIVHARVLFFDSNPIGRILTRFSKDVAVLDLIVPQFVVMITFGSFRAISVTISLCIVNYWLCIPLVIVLIYFVYVYKRLSPAMVEAQRIDQIVRGPIHSLLAMTVNGLVTIRAYEKIAYFKA